jgi:hypothetical protein
VPVKTLGSFGIVIVKRACEEVEKEQVQAAVEEEAAAPLPSTAAPQEQDDAGEGVSTVSPDAIPLKSVGQSSLTISATEGRKEAEHMRALLKRKGSTTLNNNRLTPRAAR